MRSSPGRTAEPRAGARLGQTHDDARRAIVHALPQVHRLRVAGIEEAKVVEAETQPPRQLRPRAGAPARRVGEPHVRDSAPRSARPSDAPAHRLLAIGGERDRVAARGQTLDRRLEEPQIRVVPRDEQNLQGVTPRRAAAPGHDTRPVRGRRHTLQTPSVRRWTIRLGHGRRPRSPAPRRRAGRTRWCRSGRTRPADSPCGGRASRARPAMRRAARFGTSSSTPSFGIVSARSAPSRALYSTTSTRGETTVSASSTQ